ncbi:unnamed protein product [Sphagnum balticum]
MKPCSRADNCRQFAIVGTPARKRISSNVGERSKLILIGRKQLFFSKEVRLFTDPPDDVFIAAYARGDAKSETSTVDSSVVLRSTGPAVDRRGVLVSQQSTRWRTCLRVGRASASHCGVRVSFFGAFIV